MTSEGKDFQNGYYGDTLLKPAGFNHGKDVQTYCTYTFKGVPGQRVMFHLKRLRAGSFNTEMNRSVFYYHCELQIFLTGFTFFSINCMEKK